MHFKLLNDSHPFKFTSINQLMEFEDQVFLIVDLLQFIEVLYRHLYAKSIQFSRTNIFYSIQNTLKYLHVWFVTIFNVPKIQSSFFLKPKSILKNYNLITFKKRPLFIQKSTSLPKSYFYKRICTIQKQYQFPHLAF